MTTLITRIKIKIRSIEHNVIHTVDCSRFSFFSHSLSLYLCLSFVLATNRADQPICILNHTRYAFEMWDLKELLLQKSFQNLWFWLLSKRNEHDQFLFVFMWRKKKRILFELNRILCCPFIFRAFDRSFELIHLLCGKIVW